MAVSIINNLGADNHGKRMKELILNADNVTIASPYLLPDFAKYLNELAWDSSKNLHLITTLVPKSEDQFRKIRSLHNLVGHTAKQKINCQISLNNRLHGKVYVFQKNGVFTKAIVSSANMTENGMKNFHEWGVLVEDPIIVKQIHSELLSGIEFNTVNHVDILVMYQKMKTYLAKNKLPKLPKINLNLTELIKGRPALGLGAKTKFWLKPIGYSLEHVNPKESYDQKTKNLHFSKGEPTNVSVGDILIAFAVGSGKILSVYKVLSPPLYTHDGDRWPWYVDSKNLTQEYGRNWWSNSLTKEFLKIQFEKVYPGKKIKPSGSQGYGAFNWGWDRLEISTDFGNFIIDQVLAKSGSV